MCLAGVCEGLFLLMCRNCRLGLSPYLMKKVKERLAEIERDLAR